MEVAWRAVLGAIVPVRGFAPYLAEALDCVLGQDPPPGAVVVVDDASPERVVLHPDHAAHVELVRREVRGGPAGARASGLEALGSSVELVALCDADDAWMPGKLAAQMRAFDEASGTAVCFGSALVVGPDGRVTGERWDDVAAGAHSGDMFARRLYAANPIPTSSVVVRRDALVRAGGFASPVALAEDWELWLRLAAAGERFVSVPEAVVRYRRHPGGLTADVAALARCQEELHTLHGELVDAPQRDRALAADRAALRAARRGGLRGLLPRRDPYRR